MWQGAGSGANATIASGVFQQRFHLDNVAPESITLAGATAVTYSGVLGGTFDFGQLSAIDPNGDTVLSYQIVDGAGNPTTSSRVEITGDAASGYHIALKAGVTLDPRRRSLRPRQISTTTAMSACNVAVAIEPNAGLEKTPASSLRPTPRYRKVP